MGDLALKTILFIAWPFIASFILLMCVVVLALAWPAILFGSVKHDADGKTRVGFIKL